VKISIASANLAAIDAGSPVPPQQLPAGWDTEFRFFADRDLPPRAEAISPRLQSKLPKMCGFEWFKDADLIGWLDCAYTVTTPGLAAWLIEQLGDADICLMRHPDRTGVSEEIAFMAQRMQQGDDYLISRYAGEPMAEQVQSYLSDPGFHDGWLAAAGCFVYRNTPTVRAAMKDWLIECIRWSSQDQLSLPYVLQRHGIEPRWMDASIWQSPHLRYDGHRATAGSGSPAPSAKSAQPSIAAYEVVQVRPSGYPHAEALTEIAECVHGGLRRLGLRSFYGEHPDCPVRQIVLGAHMLDGAALDSLPADAIIYNSEQIDSDSRWLTGPYVAALRTHEVWDYSAENVRRLTTLGVPSVQFVPVGYIPEQVRIPHPSDEIDVLFYGSVNPRRQHILDQLKAQGLNVVVLFGKYGEERDAAIARAKVVLIVHYYESKIFEVVRAAYLLSNRKAVVAEIGPDTFVEPDLRGAVRGVPYEQLVGACVELARDPAQRYTLGERAQQIFSARREEDILAAALRLAPQHAAVATPTLPATLQLGSGKDFRADCFNVDINPAWGPDAVFDVASPELLGSVLDTARFGKVRLTDNSFDNAIANDVLEHIGDLTTAMTNVLRLLKPGGTFNIVVPYDLGLGAWQDPTHVRAFNERSWLYYTDWHWYLGWMEARFDVVTLDVEMSPLGCELQQAGKSMTEIIRIPRAVDALRVKLRKRFLQDSERREAARRQPGRRLVQGATRA
jgi:SAM-dependent methyltransferase